MPSTPRLSTPARSATSSPAAASRSGVEAAITVSVMASSMPMSRMPRRRPSRRGDQTDAVDDERIAGEHVEQQDALKHLGEIERHLERHLRALAADEGERE